MKHLRSSLLLLVVFQLCSFSIAKAQNTTVNPYPKTISVSGSAEMEVVPDEVYVDITLKEYIKKGTGKVELKTLQDSFLKTCKLCNIPDSCVSLTSYGGSGSYYFARKKKYKSDDLLAEVKYRVMFRESRKIDLLIDRLDDEGTASFGLAYTAYSKASQVRKELKIKAIEAAKDKATYLTNAIGEQLGGAITIDETKEPADDWRQINQLGNIISQSQVMSNFTRGLGDNAGASGDDGVLFRKIKYRYEVSVVFSLK